MKVSSTFEREAWIIQEFSHFPLHSERKSGFEIVVSRERSRWIYVYICLPSKSSMGTSALLHAFLVFQSPFRDSHHPTFPYAVCATYTNKRITPFPCSVYSRDMAPFQAPSKSSVTTAVSSSATASFGFHAIFKQLLGEVDSFDATSNDSEESQMVSRTVANVN